MINYMYLGSCETPAIATPQKSTRNLRGSVKVEDPEDATPQGSKILPLYAKTYVLGERYGLPGLCEEVTYDIWAFVQEHRNCFMRSSFLDAVRIIYSETPESARAVRMVLVKALARDRDNLRQEGPKALMREFADLTMDLATTNQSDAPPVAPVSGTKRRRA